MKMTTKFFRLLLLWMAMSAGSMPVCGSDIVLTEDFSGQTNIFGITATELAVGSAAVYDTKLGGFGPVLAVCKTTVEGSIAGADGKAVDFSQGIAVASWDAFHGYLGYNLGTTVSLLNSDGKELVSYVYNCQQCKITNVAVGGQDVVGFEAFSLQNGNGFGGNGKPYPATGNPHVSIEMTARGGVKVVFSKNGSEVQTVLGSLGTLTKDIATMRIASTVNNTDRCYAVDNIVIATDVLEQDPNYIEGIASMLITGADRMTFGPSTAEAYSNPYTVNIVGTDGTTLTEETISSLVKDFRVVWDIEGFKTANDTEGQYCDSYGAFSRNGEGRVQTTFDLRDVPMNFFGRMTATVTYNGTTAVASKYVVAQGNPDKPVMQVLPLAGYPASISHYPDALVGYKVTGDTYGSGYDVILGGWCVAGSDSHVASLLQDADGTKFVRLTASAAKKSHVLTKTIDAPTGQLIFRNRLRFNHAGAVVTLTSGYPFWASSRYTCPVALNFDGNSLKLNGTALTANGADVQLTTGTWYDIVLSADKSSESCYAMVYAADGSLLAESGVVAWAETSNPTFFSIGMGNSNTGSVDMASYEAFLPTVDADSYTLTADRSTLSIPQGEQARLTAAIADRNGYAVTGLATWTVLEEDMQPSLTITPDAVDSHIATVALTPVAEAGTATIQVSIGGSTKTLPLNLTSSAESIKFTQSTTSITIPLDADQTATATFAAQVIDGEGRDIGSSVVLTAYDRDGQNRFADTDAIRFDAATGVLSVGATALPTQLTIRATGNNSESKELSRAVKVNIHGMKFDFGLTAEGALAEGFTAVGPTTAYSAADGYGIKSGTPVAGGAASAADAKSDYLQGALEFDFKMQKGDFYNVEITYQGKLTTGYVNSDLAGYELGTHTTLTTDTYTIPATVDIADLHIADADATHVAQIAQVSITKQPRRQQRGKRVVHHIGDSTSANNGSWAYRLSKIAGSAYPELAALCDFQNNGAGGRNLCTYYTQGKLASVLRDIYPGDVVMFGNNGTNGMGSSFEADMNYYLNAAETLGAQIIINSYTPHGAVAGYASGYNASKHTFDSYRKDSYETIVRRVAGQRATSDADYLGFVEIGKNADAAFNAYIADYAAHGYASEDAAAQAIIQCFTDHNHYSNGTLACDLMLGGYGQVKGIVAQLVDILGRPATGIGVPQGRAAADAAAVYTLSGQRIEKIHRPGLYIVGGRKVVVR